MKKNKKQSPHFALTFCIETTKNESLIIVALSATRMDIHREISAFKKCPRPNKHSTPNVLLIGSIIKIAYSS